MTLPFAEPEARREFARFAVAGILGFGVDVAVLYGTLALGAGLGPGRVLSFLAAATSTWAFNRRYTFSATASPWREWCQYMGVMLVGMTVNVAAYSVALFLVREPAWWRPALAVAAGSGAGLFVNFANARRFIYKSS